MTRRPHFCAAHTLRHDADRIPASKRTVTKTLNPAVASFYSARITDLAGIAKPPGASLLTVDNVET